MLTEIPEIVEEACGHASLCPRGLVRACYFIAPKRLSNEFDDTIGAEPATWAAAGAGAAAAVAEASVMEGFSAGLTAACLVSTGLASGFGAMRTTDGCGLASATFGLGGGGGALACFASALPPMPTLRARLEKKPSDFSAGAAEAVRGWRPGSRGAPTRSSLQPRLALPAAPD